MDPVGNLAFAWTADRRPPRPRHPPGCGWSSTGGSAAGDPVAFPKAGEGGVRTIDWRGELDSASRPHAGSPGGDASTGASTPCPTPKTGRAPVVVQWRSETSTRSGRGRLRRGRSPTTPTGLGEVARNRPGRDPRLVAVVWRVSARAPGAGVGRPGSTFEGRRLRPRVGDGSGGSGTLVGKDADRSCVQAAFVYR